LVAGIEDRIDARAGTRSGHFLWHALSAGVSGKSDRCAFTLSRLLIQALRDCDDIVPFYHVPGIGGFCWRLQTDRLQDRRPLRANCHARKILARNWAMRWAQYQLRWRGLNIIAVTHGGWSKMHRSGK